MVTQCSLKRRVDRLGSVTPLGHSRYGQIIAAYGAITTSPDAGN